ncbi:acyl-CoA dehydrogenase family protein [Nesterenkonia lutea]|uniref:Alkylation response protein AidB-like acyl-CoA dehydrogenase n=1 Tax=Nesterenkonia lutea TaxID=272919 RepID=A0ABR9JG25_9MICC|nr:acyl-CoA dehydrogenase family protein [Nesterenkonia lutea]MBE1524886.1 alkylation response protein AidB-like acyl-CoA dehydrogenase [Nesterenkonia lutea]
MSHPLNTTAEPRTHWTGGASAAELEDWSSIATHVAQTLAGDAVERDRANETPYREARLLKASGLVTLLVPEQFGGGGGHWATALEVIRILARADASIAQLLAYHYINEANILFSIPEPRDRERWFRATAQGQWIWGDSVNPTDPDLTLVPTEDGYRLNGRKRYSTGSAVGDVLLVNARVSEGPETGRILAFVLEHGRRGVTYVDDWDFLGQRLSSSNTVTYSDVLVGEDDVLGFLTEEPYSALVTPGIQLAFGNLYLGIAEGALAKGRELINARPNAWFLSTASKYRHDPFVQRLVGELKANTAGVAALAERVNRRFEHVLTLGEEVTDTVRGELAIEIAELKVISSDVATRLTHQIFEATGTSSTASKHGFDLYWRNIRTHSLHDPVDYKKLEVGAHFLNGEFQPISLYT